jgi:site-specific DNA-methyltransferase (adenine-specific)
MFSFFGDTVLDPFCGTGTTMIAAMKYDRNSIGVEIDSEYCRMAAERIKKENQSLFPNAHLDFSESASMQEVSGFNTVSI